MILHSSVHILMFTAHINTDQPKSLVDMIDITGNNRCNLGSLKHQKQRKPYDLNNAFQSDVYQMVFCRFKAIWMIPVGKKYISCNKTKTKITIKMQHLSNKCIFFCEINYTLPHQFMFIRCLQNLTWLPRNHF